MAVKEELEDVVSSPDFLAGMLENKNLSMTGCVSTW